MTGRVSERSGSTPVVVPLALGWVTLPSSHPRADGAGDLANTCPIRCQVVDHPDGLIVVDTGPRVGHPVIDELYAPEVVTVVEALNDAGFDERDVAALVLTHLHFDHCGQHHLFPSVPVWLAAAEIEAASEPYYTVPEWAEVDPDRRRISVDGDELAPGVRILHTPGHTPGHQSVAVVGPDGLELVVGQACYDCAEFIIGEPAPTDAHGEHWREVGQASLDRLRALQPARAHFSHDATVFEPS